MNLFRQVVAHPVAAGMLFLAALVFGYVSYQRLSVELMPDIAYPTITVRTVFEGAAPQEVEGQISRPVEEALATLDGLVTIESRSRAGSSDVVLGFDWGTDMNGAVQTIRENLQTTWLPTEADRPLILRYDPSLDPFLRIALAMESTGNAEKDLFVLRDLADRELKRELESMPGVAAARVRGGLEREIRVEVREDWLAARRVSLDAVKQALSSENINVAGGSIIEGDTEYLVRTLNEYTTRDELESLTLRRDDGVLVPLTDVAVILETHRERTVMSRLNGIEAVEIEIFKEADANVVDVARRVKMRLMGNPDRPSEEELKAIEEAWGEEAANALRGPDAIIDGLPEGVRLQLLDDQAAFIELAVDNLRNTAIFGGFLAVFVLFLFLRDFRSTAIIGLAIPVSVVIGFAPLYLLGVSLNLMSLGGLALGVGMLVDNAVVVLESIQRYREEGDDRFEAAVKGVADVATAVTASTLTTVAVFFPITFVEGVGGELFGDLSLAVVSSLLASLAVALFLVPMLAALDVDFVREGGSQTLGLLRGYSRGELGIRELGRGLVVTAGGDAWAEWKESLAWWKERKLVRFLLLLWALVRLVGSAAVGVVVVFALMMAAFVGRIGMTVLSWVVWPFAGALVMMSNAFNAVYTRFEANYHRGLDRALVRGGSVLVLAVVLFVVSMGLVRGLGSELIPEMEQSRFTVEASLPVGTPLQHTQKVMFEVERAVFQHPDVASVYSTVGADKRADSGADEGDHSARLRVQVQPGADQNDVMDEVRLAIAEVADVETKLSAPALFSFRTPVEVVVFGWDLDLLKNAGNEVVDRMSGIPGLRDVRTSLVDGHPEVRIHYDRGRLHRLGLDPATVAGRVRDKVQGAQATEIHQGDKRVELIVQLVERDRGTLSDLRSINVNPNLLPAIPLDAVADFEEALGPSEIRRVDQQRAVVVGANVEGFDLGTASSDIDAALQGLSLPDDMSWSSAGQSKEMTESLASLRFALMLAIFLVYVIMASTFENLVHPFVILFSVPLALVGTVAGLWLWGLPVSVVVLIGGIVLAGVVVNNAIVLVDTINRLRLDGLERQAAIRKAAHLRLRPILITTATTVLGLAPLSLGFGAGAEVQQPLAVAVIGGLLSSTLLTLVVIPVLYGAVTRPARSTAPSSEGVGAPS